MIETRTNTNSLLSKVVKLLPGVGLTLIVGCLVIPPILSKSETTDKLPEITEINTENVRAASYTILIDKKSPDITIKFHSQNSEIVIKNPDPKNTNCLLEGGGISCVIGRAYEPKSAKEKSKIEVTQASYKFSQDITDTFLVVVGTILLLLFVKIFFNKQLRSQ